MEPDPSPSDVLDQSAAAIVSRVLAPRNYLGPHDIAKLGIGLTHGIDAEMAKPGRAGVMGFAARTGVAWRPRAAGPRPRCRRSWPPASTVRRATTSRAPVGSQS